MECLKKYEVLCIFLKKCQIACKNIATKIWDKVFKNGLGKFCGRQPLKNLLSPLLNTLSHMFRLYLDWEGISKPLLNYFLAKQTSAAAMF